MKKILTIIFFSLTISSFSNEIDKHTISYNGTNISVYDDTPYVKEIVAVDNKQRLENAVVENKKISGFVKTLTKEVEEEITKLDKYSIIYKSYLFTKSEIKVRVLYIDENSNFKTY